MEKVLSFQNVKIAQQEYVKDIVFPNFYKLSFRVFRKGEKKHKTIFVLLLF